MLPDIRLVVKQCRRRFLCAPICMRRICTGASQWDGDYQPIAQNDVAVYIFMAENDEYYGSAKARSAYEGLQRAWREKGYTDEQISELLALEIPDNEYFNSRGIYNYHGGGNILFNDENILNWILAKRKA